MGGTEVQPEKPGGYPALPMAIVSHRHSFQDRNLWCGAGKMVAARESVPVPCFGTLIRRIEDAGMA